MQKIWLRKSPFKQEDRLGREGTFTSDCPSGNRLLRQQILPYSAQAIGYDHLWRPRNTLAQNSAQAQLHKNSCTHPPTHQQKVVLASQQGGFGGLHTQVRVGRLGNGWGGHRMPRWGNLQSGGRGWSAIAVSFMHFSYEGLSRTRRALGPSQNRLPNILQ